MKRFIKTVSLICCLAAALVFTSCARHAEAPGEGTKNTTALDSGATTEPTMEPAAGAPEESDAETFKEGENVNITITMEDGGVMQLELYPDKAPKTVENFVKLANEGFYNGLTFHRIIEGFMVQGGDPEGTGFGGSDETIPGEFASNNFAQNDISHVRGVISMARSQMPNSASSQFFIVHADSTYLDGQYAAFGMMTDGFDVLDRLAATEVGADGQTPVAKPVIQTITVQ